MTSPKSPQAGDWSAIPTATGAGAGKLKTATVTPNDTPPLVANPATGAAAATSASSPIAAAGPMTDLTPADAVRLVANTAVIARTVAPEIQVSAARRAGTPGLLIWIPGWLWDGRQLVASDSGKTEEAGNAR